MKLILRDYEMTLYGLQVSVCQHDDITGNSSRSLNPRGELSCERPFRSLMSHATQHYELLACGLQVCRSVYPALLPIDNVTRHYVKTQMASKRPIHP